jgi:hypothetical protein
MFIGPRKNRYDAGPDFLGDFAGPDSETVMRRVCRFLDIAFDPVMLTPTFQHMPIKANTSFENQRYGVLPDAANCRSEVPADEVAAIEAGTSGVYAAACEMIAAQG